MDNQHTPTTIRRSRLVQLMAAQLRKPHGRVGRLLGWVMAGGHQPLYDWTLPMMHLRPDDTVLDIGCGSGRSSQMLAAKVVQGRVIGVDYSAEMVRQARYRNRTDVRAGRAWFLQCDVAALPCAEASVDKVLAVETLFFWPGPLESLCEVRRVLRPGGLVAITMEISKEAANQQAIAEAEQYNLSIFSRAEMHDLLTAAGFHAIHIEVEPERGMGRICTLGTR